MRGKNKQAMGIYDARLNPVTGEFKPVRRVY
jgi:hypothetical protein